MKASASYNKYKEKRNCWPEVRDSPVNLVEYLSCAHREGGGESVEVMAAIGAERVVNSPLPSFNEDILTTVKGTGATVAFDATGGGRWT